jgi:hypothetical protein
MSRAWLLGLCLLSTIGRPAWAQDPTPPRASRGAWVEIGGGVAWLAAPGDSGWFPSTQLRVNVTPRLSADLRTDWFVGRGVPGFHGFYVLEVRQLLEKPIGGVVPFVSGGVAGEFESRFIQERRFTLPTGDVVVNAARRYNQISRPFAATLGGGARLRVARHLFVEPAAHIWLARDGVAAALNAGIMVALGGGD